MRSPLRSLQREITPPPLSRSRSGNVPPRATNQVLEKSVTIAQVEEGKATIQNHLDFFSDKLRQSRSAAGGSAPLLSIPDFRVLYLRNQHAHGHHFVIHQHNHPIAGVHYDLRLQFSETSCISFAIPYGLPGNPNSQKPSRLALETRVHTLWNNLVEGASYATGSMLIWDTGEYSILPRSGDETSDEERDDHDHARGVPASSTSELGENTKLIQGFQNRKIRLRLHGHKLPEGYTVKLSLPSRNNHEKREPQAKRRRVTAKKRPTQQINTDSEDENGEPINEELKDIDISSDQEHSGSRQEIEANNAYPGATNDIGSIHQRNWYVALDHVGSGFVKLVDPANPKRRCWVRQPSTSTGDLQDVIDGFEPFYVMGADVERSVMTGRTSDEILRDEGVEGFVATKMWMPTKI